MRLVLIEWIDSHSGRGWQSLNKLEDDCRPLYIKSVGWLLTEQDGCKVIVPHIYDEKNDGIVLQGCGDMSIPEKSITRCFPIDNSAVGLLERMNRFLTVLPCTEPVSKIAKCLVSDVNIDIDNIRNDGTQLQADINAYLDRQSK